MSATSLAWRTIISHYLPGLLSIPGILVLGFSIGGNELDALQMLACAQKNPILLSFGLLLVPLLAGVFADDLRHSYEDGGMPDSYLRDLKKLREYQFRFFHDEYYYYVEFDGNSAITLLFSAIGIGVYLFRFGKPAWGWIIVGAFVIIGVLLGIGWAGSRREFLHDLAIFASKETSQ